LRYPIGAAQDRHSLGYPPAIGGLRHDVAIRDAARLAVREQADALAQRPNRAVAVLGDDDVDGVVGQRMARARIGPERRDRGGAMVDALPEVGDVIAPVRGEELVDAAELSLVDDMPVQREQVTDRESVPSGEHLHGPPGPGHIPRCAWSHATVFSTPARTGVSVMPSSSLVREGSISGVG